MTNNWRHLFTAQFLGVLNDNLLKSLICFIAIYWVSPENKSTIISLASAAMVFPFILLSPFAGYLAQIKQRERVFELAKLAELPIMLFALVGFFSESLPIVVGAMLLMGVQSALYSPSKYGLVKDIAQDENIAKRLGTMELLSFSGVLLGTLLAGYLADLTNSQLIVIGICLIVFAVVGYSASKKIKLENPLEKIPIKRILNPVTFFKTTRNTARQFKGVNNAVLGLASFWFIGSILQMNLLIHCPEVLGFSNTQTGWITAFVAIGIGAGCWASGRILKNRLEIGMVVFAGLGLAICSFLLSYHLSTTVFIGVLMALAFFGGLFKVPLNTWIQERTSKAQTGNVLAYSNMVVFLFILVSAIAFGSLQHFLNSYQVFQFIGCVALLITLVSAKILFNYVVRFVFWVLGKSLYSIHLKGVENIPNQSGALLIFNHVSLLDAIIITGIAPRNFRFVMQHGVFNLPVIKHVFRKLNMIPTNKSRSAQSLEEFTLACKKEVEQGHILCLFPEGQLSRNGQLLPFKKGIAHLAKVINAPVIPIHVDGVHGAPFSYKIGSSHKNGFTLNNFRRTINVWVGQPINEPKTPFEYRQAMKELEVENTRHRIKDLDKKKEMTKSAVVLFKEGRIPIGESSSLTLESLVINTPNYEMLDIAKNKVIQQGTKQGSIGKAIPGVSTKIVNQEGQEQPENTLGK